MRIANTTAVCAAALIAAGCMHRQARMNDQQGGGLTTTEPSTAQAVAPPESEQPLNNVERADQLIGENVLTADHLSAGKIDDFAIDQDSGRILYGIVGMGGVLGVGETRVAVPPALFTSAKKGAVQINTDKHKLARAPQVPGELSTKRPTADFTSKVYGYFGQTASWQGSSSSAASFNSARMASELKGMTVQNDTHQDIGKIESVVLNVPAGREVYLILSPSSDMNLGNNFYALPPGAVKLSADQKNLVANVTREKLGSAPHFAKDDWSEISNTAWAQKVYQFYGQPANFSGGTLQPTGR